MRQLPRLRGVLASTAIALASASGQAWAAGAHQQSRDDALFTGPLVAPNAAALPKGHWDIEPYVSDGIQYGTFDNDWHQHGSHNTHALRSTTLLEYGLTDRLSVGLLPQFGYNLADHGPSSNGPRLGDLTARGHFVLRKFHEGSWLPTISLALSQTLPTGKYDGLGDNPNNGLGTGIATTKIGLWTQDYFWMPNGRILRARLDLSYAIPDGHASVNGVSVYGTERGFNGKVDTGKTFTADAGVEYSMTKHWAPVFEAIYSHTSGGHMAGTISSHTTGGKLIHTATYTSNRSSDSVEVAPAIEYNWNKHYGLIAGAEVTVAGRNTGAVVTPQAALNIYY